MSDVAVAPEKAMWTEDRVSTLKQLWAEGLSASQIASRLGMGVTRNAVIGKVHRLNLAGRATQPRNSTPRSTVRKTREPSIPGRAPSMPTAGNNALKPYTHAAARPMPLPEPKPLRLIDNAKDGRVTILHLNDKTCKWPIGDPMHNDFCFCGHGPRDGSPYCEYHARIAYQPPQNRMRRAG